MNDFSHYLKANYPDLFKQKTIGIWCPQGWTQLVDGLCKYLVAIKADISIIQIKEKFGTLRFYYRINPKTNQLGSIDKAQLDKETRIAHVFEFTEYLSSTLCRNDGQPGTQHASGWLKTLCKNCKEIENESL